MGWRCSSVGLLSFCRLQTTVRNTVRDSNAPQPPKSSQAIARFFCHLAMGCCLCDLGGSSCFQILHSDSCCCLGVHGLMAEVEVPQGDACARRPVHAVCNPPEFQAAVGPNHITAYYCILRHEQHSKLGPQGGAKNSRLLLSVFTSNAHVGEGATQLRPSHTDAGFQYKSYLVIVIVVGRSILLPNR